MGGGTLGDFWTRVGGEGKTTGTRPWKCQLNHHTCFLVYIGLPISSNPWSWSVLPFLGGQQLFLVERLQGASDRKCMIATCLTWLDTSGSSVFADVALCVALHRDVIGQ